MSLSDLSSPTAIKLAIEECDRLGREEFLSRHRFSHAREYTLQYQEKQYDSKAIVGVAHGYQFPEIGTLKSTEFSGGISVTGAAAKAFALGFDVQGLKRRPNEWTLEQCEIAVDSYFQCLRSKLSGQPFNRIKACRDVATRTKKTRGSVDYKFQNIDAILYQNGLPRMMDGIAPKFQRMLAFVVLDPLSKHIAVFDSVSAKLSALPKVENAIVEPPRTGLPITPQAASANRVAWKINFAERDAGNRRLGHAGERWIVALERDRLLKAGRMDLARKIDWISDRLGDGLGYDIISFEEDGAELFLEVKTTNAGIQTPFFISGNELAVAEQKGDAYRLYRVFDFSTNPRAFILTGPLIPKLTLRPQTYAAMPAEVGGARSETAMPQASC